MEKYNVYDLQSRLDCKVFYGEAQEGDKVKVVFNVKEPNTYCPLSKEEFMEMIDDVQGNCSCTQNGIFLRNGYIEAVLDTSVVRFGNEEWEKHQDRIPYSTSITVLWKDGKPLKKQNNLGQLVTNEDKAKTYIEIYGSILKKK